MNLIALLMAFAAQASAPAPATPVDCNDKDHRALDFWIGDWDVLPAGTETVIARSRIQKIVGCAISETYQQTIGPGGQPTDYRGRSISTYVPTERVWRQFYVDSGGAVRSFAGGVVNGAVVLSTPLGSATTRMTLSANPNGTVRQHGERSTDGKSWATTYDFTYRRRASTP